MPRRSDTEASASATATLPGGQETDSTLTTGGVPVGEDPTTDADRERQAAIDAAPAGSTAPGTGDNVPLAEPQRGSQSCVVTYDASGLVGVVARFADSGAAEADAAARRATVPNARFAVVAETDLPDYVRRVGDALAGAATIPEVTVSA